MRFIRTEEGFKVLAGGRELISHTGSKPWLYAGSGTALYNMHLGNFHIESSLRERIGLTDFSVEDNAGTFTVRFSRMGMYPIKVVFAEEEDRLVIHFKEHSEDINRLWIRINAEKDEHVYGCGEQFSHFDLRGRKYPLFLTEQGVGRNKKTLSTFMADQMEGAGGDYYSTYFPQPTFVSSGKYYCHVVDSAYMEFNFINDDYHELEIWNVPEKLVISSRESFVELLEDMTGFLGRQPELPDWVYEGVWIGMQGGTETVLKKLQNALDKGLKVGAVWAQDWEGKRITYFGKRLMWNWEWDSKLYPGLDKEIAVLRDRGIRFLGYINPYLAVEGKLFGEAVEYGYLVKDREGKDYITDMGAFMAGHVDLTNPSAFEWYKNVIKKNMIGFGLSGWMADFGEYLPTDAVLYNGVSAELMHNMWPVLWAKANREAVQESGNLGEVAFFMRAGYAGSQKYTTLMWAGDQNVDWSMDDGLPSVLTAALSLGMSGVGLHHSDIGGYTTLFEMKRSKELFMRWAEMGAFAPVMRTHEGNRPEDNWQFDSDDETLLHFARMSRVYTSLTPYLKEAVRENTAKGLPVMRPLMLHYESDERAYEIKEEFLLGRDLLVAPVLEPEKTNWKLYLPEDKWIHLWTGMESNGGEVEVEAPIGYPPAFYRKGSSYSALFEKLKDI